MTVGYCFLILYPFLYPGNFQAKIATEKQITIQWYRFKINFC